MCGKEEEEREAVEATLHHCVNQAVSFGIPVTADIQSTTLVGGIETHWGHTACTSLMTNVGNILGITPDKCMLREKTYR